MKVLYKDLGLKKLCNNEKEAYKKLGKVVAEKLFAAIELLESAKNLKDVLCLPQYNLHALKAKLDGFYSMYLGKTTGFRLIIIPLDENENEIVCNDLSIYTSTVCVKIWEVSKHYEKS